MRHDITNRNQPGFTFVELLGVLTVILVLVAIGLHIFLKSGPAGSSHPPPPVGNPVPSGMVVRGAWSGTQANVQVNNRYTYIYTLERSNPTSLSGFAPLDNTTVSFAIGPTPHVRIISVNGHLVMGTATATATNSAGQISVVFEVLSEPPTDPSGGLAAMYNLTGTTDNTPFEITQ